MLPSAKSPVQRGEDRTSHSVRVENLLCSGIDAAVSGIADVEGGDGAGLRDDAGGDTHCGGAGRINGRPDARADSGKEGSAVGGAFFGFDNFNWVAVDVGLDLPPQRRASATTAEADVFYGHVHFLEDREGVAQAEGHAFEDGANDMRACVRGGEADEGGASICIEMRSALAHQIGCPQEAVGTGGNSGGFFGEAVVGFSRAARIHCECVAEPAQREPRGLRYAHDVPASGNRVAESVHATLGIERGTIRGGKDDAGGADGGADGSGCDDAHAGGASGLVACASHNRSADFQTSFRSASGRKFSADLGRFEQARQESLVKFRSLQHSARPAAMGYVEEESTGSVGHVRGALAGEAQADVVLREQHAADALPVFGFVFADPKKLCKREIGKGRIAGELNQSFLADFRSEIKALLLGADVAPD